MAPDITCFNHTALAALTLHIRGPNKEPKMSAINEVLGRCSVEYPMFFEDEVDIHLNPKLGVDLMLRGKQKKVATPGQKRKHYLAGALHAGTGNVTYVASDSKDTEITGQKLVLIMQFQLVYAPWVNQIYRVWHAHHEAI